MDFLMKEMMCKKFEMEKYQLGQLLFYVTINVLRRKESKNE